MNYLEEVTKTIETAKSAKDIKEMITWICGYNDINNQAVIIFKMVVENSNDFTKDIAKRALDIIESYSMDEELEDEAFSSLSEKQQWCIAYQVFNNKEVYLTK